MNRTHKIIGTIFALLLAVSAGGCATTAEIDRLREEIQVANNRAARAEAAAEAATLEAQEARAASERAGKAAVDARDAVTAMDKRFDDLYKSSLNR